MSSKCSRCLKLSSLLEPISFCQFSVKHQVCVGNIIAKNVIWDFLYLYRLKSEVSNIAIIVKDTIVIITQNSLSILLNLFRPSTRGLYITVNDLRNVYISKKSKTFNCCEFFYVICEYADIFLSVKFVHAIRYRFCLYILRKVCQNALYGDEYKVQTSCKKLSATAAYNCCFRLWL